MRVQLFLLCCLCVNFVCANSYKGGVIDVMDYDIADIVQLVYEAGKEKVDVLVLSSDFKNPVDNYDEDVKALSKAAKHAGLYLVAHLNDKTVCQKKPELVRSNLVFDRQGSIASVYRKASTTTTNCTASTSDIVTFTTDFGVTFGVMMEEDLVLKSEDLDGLTNFVVTGSWTSEIPFLSASQFSAAWAYTADVNVVSSNGIFAGKAGAKTASGSLVTADLKSVGDEETASSPPVVNPATIQNFPGEDLSQYIVKPLNIEASSGGYKKFVCHNSFCCEFNVKTKSTGSKQDVNYGLAAFDGIRHFGGSYYIGTQNCAVFACAGLYKRTCSIGSRNNNTRIIFEKVTVTANFTGETSIQYPLILSNELLPAERLNFITKIGGNMKEVTVSLTDSDNLLAFGIFGRDFQNDYVSSFENQDGGYGIYDYIFTEDLQEFFDYVWIRLRIFIFIVSIYVLEMM